MTNEEKNEKMALEIKELLVKYDIFHLTRIYFNNKCFSSPPEEKEVIESIKVEDHLEWCNPEMVNMSFEGDASLYMIVNWYIEGKEAEDKANRVINEFADICEKYNRHYNLGDDCTLYFKSREDKRNFEAFQHPNIIKNTSPKNCV